MNSWWVDAHQKGGGNGWRWSQEGGTYLGCDTGNVMCVYLPSIPDNLNVIYSPHTVNRWIYSAMKGRETAKKRAERESNFHYWLKCSQKSEDEGKMTGILTRCPFVLSCSGKHILHTSQWKKLVRPPIRQMPHPSQWYWSLSSSSNRLQTKHVYCERRIRDGKKKSQNE